MKWSRPRLSRGRQSGWMQQTLLTWHTAPLLKIWRKKVNIYREANLGFHPLWICFPQFERWIYSVVLKYSEAVYPFHTDISFWYNNTPCVGINLPFFPGQKLFSTRNTYNYKLTYLRHKALFPDEMKALHDHETWSSRINQEACLVPGKWVRRLGDLRCWNSGRNRHGWWGRQYRLLAW